MREDSFVHLFTRVSWQIGYKMEDVIVGMICTG